MYRVTINWLYKNHADVESAHIFRSTVHNSEKEFQDALNNNDFTDLTLVKSYDDLTQLTDNSTQTHTDISVAKNTAYFYAITARSAYGKYRLGVFAGVGPSDTELLTSDRPENSSVYGVYIPDFADVHTTEPVFNITSESIASEVPDNDSYYIKTELQSAMDWWGSSATLPSDATSLMDNGLISIELVIEDLGASAHPATSQILEYIGLNGDGTVAWGTTFTKRARITFNSHFVAESQARYAADPSKTTLMYALARHELFHLLGMGSTLINSSGAHITSNSAEGSPKIYYLGTNALDAYKNKLPNSFDEVIQGIPLEDNGGAGTENMHFEAGDAYVDLDSLLTAEEPADDGSGDGSGTSDSYSEAVLLLGSVDNYKRSDSDISNMLFGSDYNPASSSFFNQLNFFGAHTIMYGYGDFTTTGAVKDYSAYKDKYDAYLSRTTDPASSSDEILENYIIYELTNNFEQNTGLQIPTTSTEWVDGLGVTSPYDLIMDRFGKNKFHSSYNFSSINMARVKSIAENWDLESSFWNHGLTWASGDENISMLANIVFNFVAERLEPPYNSEYLTYQYTRRYKHWAVGVLAYNLFEDTSSGLSNVSLTGFGGAEASDQGRHEADHPSHKAILKNILLDTRSSVSLS